VKPAVAVGAGSPGNNGRPAAAKGKVAAIGGQAAALHALVELYPEGRYRAIIGHFLYLWYQRVGNAGGAAFKRKIVPALGVGEMADQQQVAMPLLDGGHGAEERLAKAAA